jgi:parvulin-like peptidyl-prolyl isomerase
MKLTEAELRQHIAADLRWDKYASGQATDKALHDLFDQNKEMFDGSMVHARHILLTPKEGDAPAAQARLLQIKKDVADYAAAGLAKLPANADDLARQRERFRLLDERFRAYAKQDSACPSKNQEGDVGWFQRAGFMVEPFSRAAFALKQPGDLSDVVKTQFGYHLILLLEHKAGSEVKFEEVKDDVREVYCDRLRESLVAQLRPRAQIVITPVKP